MDRNINDEGERLVGFLYEYYTRNGEELENWN